MRTCTRGHQFTGEEPCPVCWPGYRTFRVRAKVWLYPGAEAAWHFITVPKKQSDLMKKRFGAVSRGWGSLPVMVTIGSSTWHTSVFPDKKRGAYILPLKAIVRRAEKIVKGDTIKVALEVRV